MEECLKRNVKSAFICPHHQQQNFAEGYIGRVTSMASFGMVFSGAPLFMWHYSVRSAAFVNNIAASYYSHQTVWATPYELIHGERFADSSIVVPFGCAALVLLDKKDRETFRDRCVLMIFLHYTDDHPLFTYAFYSPKTKRILYRQDVIFLVSVFPMRSARIAANLDGNGEALIAYRSPPNMRSEVPDELSFQEWTATDPLPAFSDEVSGFELSPPDWDGAVLSPAANDLLFPVHFPEHAKFGPVSVVPVPARAMPGPFSSDETLVVGTKNGFVQDGQSEDTLLNKDFLSTKKTVTFGEVSAPDLEIAHETKIADCGEIGQSRGFSDQDVLQTDSQFEVFGGIDQSRGFSEKPVFVDELDTLQFSVPVSVPKTTRRRVHQRWTYEPRGAETAAEVVTPVLFKRRSKPPQRLTAHRLGLVAHGPAEESSPGPGPPASVSSSSLVVSHATSGGGDLPSIV